MARRPGGGKALPLFYPVRSIVEALEMRAERGGRSGVVGLSLAMFIALFGWGSQYFGWSDPQGKVQLALFTTFILGVICGYKNKG